MGDFRRLEAWQFAAQLATEVYRITASFPMSERYGLSAHMRRAAVSVSSNIAEGSGRGSAAELRRFMSIARGSLHEVSSQLYVARELGFLLHEEWHHADQRIDRISRMLLALSRKP